MNRIFLLITLSYANLTVLTASSDVSKSILQNVSTGLHQIRLPDGKSLYGDATAVMGTGYFDLSDLDNDTTAAFETSAQFIAILKNPVKSSSWRQEYHTAADVFFHFQKSIDQASHLNPIAIQVLWHFLRDGNIHGVHLPGLTPQPERAVLFKELYEWRMGMRVDANNALESIRIERERLNAIAAAEEESKRKAKEEARTAAEAIRISAVTPMNTDKLSTVRRRKPFGDTIIVESTDDHTATAKTSLLGLPIKAH